MSQTPVFDSPIFDQLATEFASRGKAYDNLINWTAPEFVWDPTRPVVPLDKSRRRGVNITKPEGYVGGASGQNIPAELPPFARALPTAPGRVVRYVKSSDGILSVGDIVQDFLAEARAKFTEQYPLAIVTDAHTEMNADGSAKVVFEAVQPITPVMPLSEKDTAKPME